MFGVFVGVLAALDVSGWSAAECPSASLEVKAATSSVPLVARVEKRGDRFVGTLTVSRDGQARTRRHEAPTCAAVLDALALDLDLAAVPKTSHETVKLPKPLKIPMKVPGTFAPSPEVPKTSYAAPEPAQVPDTSPPLEPTPAVPKTSYVSPKASEPLENSVKVPGTFVAAAEVPDTSAALAPEVSLGGVVVLGPAPAPGFGAALGLGFAPLPYGFRVDLGVLHARTATLDLASTRGRFSLTEARALVCSPSLSRGRFDASLCAGLGGGVLWGQAFASATVPTTREVMLPWASGLIEARASMQLGAGLTLRLAAGPTVPFSRHTFVFEVPRVTLHEVPAIGFGASVGIGWAP